MATERVILCGPVSSIRLPASDPKPLRLRAAAPGLNVRLPVEQLRGTLLATLPDRFLDLLEIAAYVYCADHAVPRGTERDVDFGQRWRRRLFFRMAVRDPDAWNYSRLRGPLTRTLSFLSEDEYHFEFERPRGGRAPEPFLRFQHTPFAGRIEEVGLFSGGLDSVAGAVQ